MQGGAGQGPLDSPGESVSQTGETSLPELIVVQAPTGVEARAVTTAAMLMNVPLRRAALEDLQGLSPTEASQFFRSTPARGVLPVGSVEFVRAAMAALGVPEPENITYPPTLADFLRRDVRRTTAGAVLGTWFVKPVTTKAFTGFVFDTMSAPEDYPEHERESYAAFMALEPHTEVWISEPVRFVSEWRYYVQGGQVIGAARYDPDGAEDAPEPDRETVARAAIAMAAAPGAPAACSLDFGVLESGETALVEANDAWALGLYGRGLGPREYATLLTTRWQQIATTAPRRQIKP